MGHGTSLLVSSTQFQSTSRDTVLRRKMRLFCDVQSPLIMLKFGMHQILSFQLFKALRHAWNTGKVYNRNYTTGSLQWYTGREARSIIRKSLDRSQKIGPPVVWFSHMKICVLYFSSVLPSPSLFLFLFFFPQSFFLCSVSGWCTWWLTLWVLNHFCLC